MICITGCVYGFYVTHMEHAFIQKILFIMLCYDFVTSMPINHHHRNRACNPLRIRGECSLARLNPSISYRRRELLWDAMVFLAFLDRNVLSYSLSVLPYTAVNFLRCLDSNLVFIAFRARAGWQIGARFILCFQICRIVDPQKYFIHPMQSAQ
jgi:hypothetical protein